MMRMMMLQKVCVFMRCSCACLMAPLWAHQRDSDIEVLTFSVSSLIIIIIITIIIMVTLRIPTKT